MLAPGKTETLIVSGQKDLAERKTTALAETLEKTTSAQTNQKNLSGLQRIDNPTENICSNEQPPRKSNDGEKVQSVTSSLSDEKDLSGR